MFGASPSTVVAAVVAFFAGWQLWILSEYLLHRFAMHALHGKGIMSREHLNHHVAAGWNFSYVLVLAWAGMLLVGWLVWFPLGLAVFGAAVGVGLALGWAVGYFVYEAAHAREHLKGPRTSRQRHLRKHHFHHHFGHPMANHGVSVVFWDKVFGTFEEPDRVRVPRRMAQPWMLGDDGELKPEHEGDYVLVGSTAKSSASDERDRVAAFAGVAPAD